MKTTNQHRRAIKKELSTNRINKDLQIKDSGHLGTGERKSVKILINVWQNPPKVTQLTPKDEGKKVWIAGESSTFKAILKRYYHPGEGSFPDGGLEVVIKDINSDRGLDSVRTFFYEEVVLHPDELTESRLAQHGYEVGDKRRG